MLKSVVVHLIESSSSGHYISYTWDKFGEMVYNDCDVHRVMRYMEFHQREYFHK